MPMKSNDESFSSASESDNSIAIPQSQLSESTHSHPCKLPNSSFIVDPAFAFLFIYIIQTITHENVNAYDAPFIVPYLIDQHTLNSNSVLVCILFFFYPDVENTPSLLTSKEHPHYTHTTLKFCFFCSEIVLTILRKHPYVHIICILLVVVEVESLSPEREKLGCPGALDGGIFNNYSTTPPPTGWVAQPRSYDGRPLKNGRNSRRR